EATDPERGRAISREDSGLLQSGRPRLADRGGKTRDEFRMQTTDRSLRALPRHGAARMRRLEYLASRLHDHLVTARRPARDGIGGRLMLKFDQRRRIGLWLVAGWQRLGGMRREWQETKAECSGRHIACNGLGRERSSHWNSPSCADWYAR